MDIQEDKCFQTDSAFTDSSSPFGSIFHKNTKTSFSDGFKKEFSNEALLVVDSLKVRPIDVQHNASQPDVLQENKLETGTAVVSNSVIETSGLPKTKLISNGIVPNQVDISKFLYPGIANKPVVKESSHHTLEQSVSLNANDKIKNNGILESVFSSSLHSQTADVFHTTEEINQIHQQSVQHRTEAFQQVAQANHPASNDSLESTLEEEFLQIIKSEHVTTFIDEFEQLIAQLGVKKSALKQNPNNLENLIEFKLTIHLIKVLSEMMQAVNLSEFSQTVIEFLDDLVEGYSTMALDVFERLSLVVDYYNYYNDAINKK